MEKKCPDCDKPCDSNDFKTHQIGNHLYMRCPNGHEYEVYKANENDWEYFIPKRPKKK